MTEGQLQDAIRLALNDVDLVLWRNSCGVATIGTRTQRFGVGNPGGADLIGLFRGRFVAVEIKTPIGRQSAAQRTWQALVERKGGVYVILRSVEDARAWLADLRSAA